MSRWTKRDVKTLCQTISTFWLVNRPLGDSLSEHERVLEAVRWYLVQHRSDVVCAGVAELGEMAAERARQDQETADHFRDHPEIYGKSTPAMIERFSKLAAVGRGNADKAERLVVKIRSEGLPPEVVAFDPVASSG